MPMQSQALPEKGLPVPGSLLGRPLPQLAVAQAGALRPGWPLSHRQQPLREHDPPVCGRALGLAVQ